MIAVDTSALISIVLDEPASDACIKVLKEADRLLISAGTVAEVLIVAARKNVAEEIAEIFRGLPFVVSVTEATARRTAAAYAQWGMACMPQG